MVAGFKYNILVAGSDSNPTSNRKMVWTFLSYVLSNILIHHDVCSIISKDDTVGQLAEKWADSRCIYVQSIRTNPRALQGTPVALDIANICIFIDTLANPVKDLDEAIKEGKIVIHLIVSDKIYKSNDMFDPIDCVMMMHNYHKYLEMR